MKFGWVPDSSTFANSDFKIQPLADHKISLACILDSNQAYEDWFYPYLKEDGTIPIPVPRFELPVTHEITYNGQSDAIKIKEFLVLAFGFVKGLLLRPEGWGHFYKVALKQGQLTDFVAMDGDTTEFLSQALTFWRQLKSDDTKKLIFGAIHWFLLSQSYEQYFERFMMQYTAFDALWKINSKIHSLHADSHADRFIKLTNFHKMDMPHWAEKTKDNQSQISIMRNELIHEAQFCGSPIGFTATDGTNILLQLIAFNSRLIVATLGAYGAYTRSPSDSRQYHLLKTD